MLNSLSIVNGVIEEHHAVRGHMKLVGDSVTDLEALFTLQKARPDWILGTLEEIRKRQEKLLQTVSSLDEGLGNHFAYEEKVLPPLFGELLMRALALQHERIKVKTHEVKSLVRNSSPEALNQKELLATKSRIQRAVEHLLQLVEDHAAKEETILQMLREALESEGKSQQEA